MFCNFAEIAADLHSLKLAGRLSEARVLQFCRKFSSGLFSGEVKNGLLDQSNRRWRHPGHQNTVKAHFHADRY